jgi:hypothetical protein
MFKGVPPQGAVLSAYNEIQMHGTIICIYFKKNPGKNTPLIKKGK